MSKGTLKQAKFCENNNKSGCVESKTMRNISMCAKLRKGGGKPRCTKLTTNGASSSQAKPLDDGTNLSWAASGVRSEASHQTMPDAGDAGSGYADDLNDRSGLRLKESDTNRGTSRQARFFRESNKLDCTESRIVGDELEQACNCKSAGELRWTEFDTSSNMSSCARARDVSKTLERAKFSTIKELSALAQLCKNDNESRVATSQTVTANVGHANAFKNKNDPA